MALLDITNLSKDELTNHIISLKQQTYRSDQIWSWVFNKGVSDFDSMDNLSKNLRQLLKEHFFVAKPEVTAHLISNDGTQKWLLKFFDGNEAEMVYIPEKDRGTLCISSQIGCTLNCTFCHTGTQRLVRNLTSGEIVQQIMIARDYLDEWPSTQEKRLISNVVLMGMGEPLYNSDNVFKALHTIMDDDGIAISRKRITLSTSGVVPKIIDCAKNLRVNLALSLHATTNEVRNRIVPLNKKYPLEALIPAVMQYQELSKSKRITFEYVMLENINDFLEDAKRLVEITKNIECIVNLIPFNPWPGTIYQCSSNNKIHKFAKFLHDHNQPTTIRTPRGQDILAACGQLKSQSQKTPKYKTSN
ncbi:MAG: 23S rRNA (adenine(2503)-C(2))-methyltransferase RlmN [Rickettsiales bacterium]